MHINDHTYYAIPKNVIFILLTAVAHSFQEVMEKHWDSNQTVSV